MMDEQSREIAKSYFDFFIKDFGRELNNLDLVKVTSNTAIIGTYAECVVRKMIKRVINFARISTGTIYTIGTFKDSSKLPQLDTIIWLPNPLPAFFEAQEFAIVSRPSVLGILEIKNSNYTGAVASMKNVIENSKDLISIKATDKEIKGVICVKTKEEALLNEMEESGKIFVLSTIRDNKLEVNSKGVLLLLNYLSVINTDSISEAFYTKIDIGKLPI